jgi:hypothetical protein
LFWISLVFIILALWLFLYLLAHVHFTFPHN